MPQFYSLLLFASAAVAMSCSGTMQAGCCCDGMILPKDHNSNSYSADQFICCQGGGQGISVGPNAPTSCTVGKQIPLTQASCSGGSSSPTDSSSSSSDSTNSASSDSSGSSNNNPTSSSANGALVTAAPLVGAVIAAGGLVLAI